MAGKPSRSAGRPTGYNDGVIGFERRGSRPDHRPPLPVGGDVWDRSAEPGGCSPPRGRTGPGRAIDGGTVVLGLFPEACLAPGHPALHTVAELSFLQFTEGVDALVVTEAGVRRCRRIAVERQFGIAVRSERDVGLASRLGLDFDSGDGRVAPDGTIVLVEPSKDAHETWPIRNPGESRVVAALHERLTEHRQPTDRYGVTHE